MEAARVHPSRNGGRNALGESKRRSAIKVLVTFASRRPARKIRVEVSRSDEPPKTPQARL